MNEATCPERRGRVITAWRAADPEPLLVSAGDDLTIEERESEWSGWIYVRNRNGKGGWIPEDYVDRSGTQPVARRYYTAVELTIHPGEELTITDEESDWFWATNDEGKSGWVPVENVEIVE